MWNKWSFVRESSFDLTVREKTTFVTVQSRLTVRVFSTLWGGRMETSHSVTKAKMMMSLDACLTHLSLLIKHYRPDPYIFCQKKRINNDKWRFSPKMRFTYYTCKWNLIPRILESPCSYKERSTSPCFALLTFLPVLVSSLQTRSLSAAMILMYSWSEISCPPNHLPMDLPMRVAEAYRIEAEGNKEIVLFLQLTKLTLYL